MPCLVTVVCTVPVDHWSYVMLFLSPSMSSKRDPGIPDVMLIDKEQKIV